MFAWAKLKRKVPEYCVPEGVRVYAIGDIHGRADLLDTLLQRIEVDAADFAGETEVVFLGDYVDRGPDSATVLDRVAAGPPPGQRWTTLKGNHEAFMVDFLVGTALEDERLFPIWMANGGRETLASYGLPSATVYGGHANEAQAALAAAMPARHREFLARLETTRRIGDYLFVHAGIRPGLPLDEQEESDLLWIRGEFLAHRSDYGFHVVHGHSITPEVDEQPNRTGIDTGAYASGRLTALVLEGAERRYLST